jgi:aminopeptidase N
VRRAVVRALGEYRNDRAARALVEHLGRGDESVLVEGELARSAGRTRQGSAYEALVAALDRPSWRDVVRIGAIDGLATLRDERAYPLIDRFADVGNGLGTRRSAVAAMGEFGENKRAVRERLESLLDGNDPYVTPEILRSLSRLKDPAAIGAIAGLQSRSLDGRVKRQCREALRELRSREHPDETRRLSDALDRLRDEHQTLRDDLARLKALVLPEEDGGAAKPASGRGAKRAKKAPRGTSRAAGTGRAKGTAAVRKTRGSRRR